MSDFVTSAVGQAAREAVKREQVVLPSAEDQGRFVEALLAPSEPVPAMVRAHEHHRRLFGGA